MIELSRPGVSARNATVVLFDFDGTLSLIRSGWVETMVPMMTGILLETQSGETEPEIEGIVTEFVGRLTGMDTVHQMIELANQVARRGGTPKDPLVYKHRYLDLLWLRIRDRIEALRSGQCSPEEYLVPGARALLERLRDRGLTMYLASGTDECYTRDEARLLDVEKYFAGGVYGALDDYKSFSKAILIQRIIDRAEARGDQFLAFGDGYVEIDNVKRVGGVAVGVATDEPECRGVDPEKRRRLLSVGADCIVPHFLELDALWKQLFAE